MENKIQHLQRVEIAETFFEDWILNRDLLSTLILKLMILTYSSS